MLITVHRKTATFIYTQDASSGRRTSPRALFEPYRSSSYSTRPPPRLSRKVCWVCHRNPPETVSSPWCNVTQGSSEVTASVQNSPIGHPYPNPDSTITAPSPLRLHTTLLTQRAKHAFCSETAKSHRSASFCDPFAAGIRCIQEATQARSLPFISSKGPQKQF